MDSDEYTRYDGIGLAELVRAGEVSPTELLDAALAQLERRNPALNAVTSLFEGIGRDSISQGLPRGPFRGSIRIPASCCGLVGLKPTRGRNPLGPDLFESLGGATTTHAVTCSVRDCAALLDVTSGADLGDPYLCHPHQGTFFEEAGLAPGQLRIAVMAEPYIEAAVDPEVRAAQDATVGLLESLGHRLEAARPRLDGASLIASVPVVFGAHVSVLLDNAAARRGRPWRQDEVEPLTWKLVCLGRSEGASAYAAAIESFQRAARVAARFHEEWDLLLSPTLATTPVPLGVLSAENADPAAGAWQAFSRFSPFAAIANLTGQPAISLPIARSGDGLPIGMMFTAGLGREDLLLRLAAQLEAASPWQLPAGTA